MGAGATYIELPKIDENGTPKTKMPDCPACRKDELYMVAERKARCYFCDTVIWEKRSVEKEGK